jgi:ribonuclease R
MKQAVYSPSNVGHFGLAFEAYVHFTSPIRRYPDLLVHRAINRFFQIKAYVEADWEALGRHCSETERRADDASRDVENWLKCYYMRDHVGGTFSGSITGVTAFGLFVTARQLLRRRPGHISELGRDYFQFDAARHVLFGERTGKRFRLADRMTVKLVRVDLESRKIDFRAGMKPGREPRVVFGFHAVLSRVRSDPKVGAGSVPDETRNDARAKDLAAVAGALGRDLCTA